MLGSGPASDYLAKILLFQDAPNHTRLRSLVWPAFRPRQVRRLRPYIEEVTDRCLDVLAAKGGGDLIADLAYPVPMQVICEFLGVPEADREALRKWSRDSALAFQPNPSPAEVGRADRAIAEAYQYMESLLGRLRAHPGENLLTELIKMEGNGDSLSTDELVTMGFFLIFAGHETTSDLIGNGVLALLRHPKELERLRNNPPLIRIAIEELARYDGPIQTLRMRAVEPIEVEGQRIEEGDQIFTVLAGANRDPAAFRDPDGLDVTRSHNDHVAFGAGIHYCLGAPLARLEAEIVIGRLIHRFRQIELSGEPVWKEALTIRGLSKLPVGIGATRPEGRAKTGGMG